MNQTTGTVTTQDMSFGAWGNRRAPGTWLPPVGSAETATDHAVDRYGFTHQEMLDNVGIIHMNGRIYDPNLGRFLSVDPVFEFPTNTQSLNPYSYVLNNPLSMTDPTGYVESCGTGKTSCPDSGMKAGDTAEKTFSPTGSHIAIHITATVQANGDVAISSNNTQVAQSISSAAAKMFGGGNGAQMSQGATDAQNKPSDASSINSPALIGNQTAPQDNNSSGIEVTGGDDSATARGVNTDKVSISMALSDKNIPTGYDTANAAAIAQYKAYNSEYLQTVKNGDELTGLIVATHGRYFFSKMVEVPEQFTAEETLVGIRVQEIAGFTHTHPDNSTFSGLDYETPARQGVPFYVRNSSGHVYRWDPAGAMRYENHLRALQEAGSVMSQETQISNPAHWGITNICPGGGACIN